ncbi:SLATT domain-containing protein [Pseudomonas sp. yb_5]|uniref:SLATT domain-containing protein n=1 Tax=Pseudomonas sp. yb_5 TaxID=3367220 RepID=UPI00370AD1D5
MTKDDLLKRWQRTIRRMQIEHELSSRYYEKLNWKLGIPVVVLSSIVGASIFATLQQTELLWLKIATGFLSVIAVVLSSLQTFLGFSERATGHKSAADRLGELAKHIQQVLAVGLPEAEMPEFLEIVRSKWDVIAREAPTLRKSTIIALAEAQEGIDQDALQQLQASS